MANSQNKLPEIRGEAFTKAREDLGLSTKDLSGMSCLSIRQIEQIENGESSSFYGAQVKVTAAKKVAALLKLNEESAFDFSGVAPLKASTTESASEPTLMDDVKTVKTKATEKKIELPKQVDGKNSEKNPKKKIFILLGIAAALVFSVVNLRPLFFPDPVKEEVLVVEEVSTANPPSENTPDSKLAPATSDAVVVAAPVAAVAPAAPSECPPADAVAVSYKTEAPKKAGDLVYLQSKVAQTVCVVDASGKTQNKTLEPGVGVSVYGKPPLKVLTSGQTPVDMFYQGVKVRLSNTTAKTIILEPTEIIQPAAPTDSQFR